MYTNMEFAYRNLSSHSGMLCVIVKNKDRNANIIDKYYFSNMLSNIR